MLRDDKIRIVDLLPYQGGDDEGPIRCEIRIAALSENPQYETLSYCWGVSPGRVNIDISGRQVAIPTSVYAALRRLQLPDKKRPLWIDQLCVDQENNEEKRHQVSLMGQIYSNCHHCLIWFGEIRKDIPLADAEAAVELIEYIADPDNEPEPASIRSPLAFKRTMQAIESISVDEYPWWKRIWTLQEAVLPPNKTIVWGPLFLTWEKLSQAAHTRTTGYPPALHRNLARFRQSSSAYVNDCLNWLLLQVLWINLTRGEHSSDSLLMLFMKWRDQRQATDPRDKVYGLLGLTLGETVSNIEKCNYETPIAQVYNAATLDLILAHSLFPLIMNPRSEEGKGTRDISKWAMDLNGPSPPSADIFYRYWGYDHYDACAGRPLNMEAFREAIAEPSSRFQTLRLEGVMVDTVEVVAAEKLYQVESNPAADMPETLHTWLTLARAHINLPSEQVDEAFCRLVLGDLIRNGELWVTRRANSDDMHKVSEFIKSGVGKSDTWRRDKALCSQVGNQVFFITKSGMIGMGHLETMPGDEVWIFDGGRVPFTIRKRQSPSDFDFVGCCYVQGIMHGEYFENGRTAVSRQTIRVY